MGNLFSWQNISTSLIIWTLNVIVLLGCLVKLLVYGDPVLKSESKANQQYWKHKKKADTEFSKVSVSVFFLAKTSLKLISKADNLLNPTQSHYIFLITTRVH